MAGTYIEILYPGYSTLWTADMEYTPGSGEASTLNPFDPYSARPLIEGEWLQLDSGATAGKKCLRGGNNVVTIAGTPDGEGTVPAFLYFLEQGRYDAQAMRKAHLLKGPYGFEFRCKLCYSTGMSVNSRVSVWDWDGPAGAWSYVRRVLAIYAAQYPIGRVTRIYGTNDIAVAFMPGGA